MKILVTGGTGMLGQSIVRKYQDRFDIRFMGRNQSLGARIASETGAEFSPAALQQQALLHQACKGVDAVIHCAALSSPWGAREEFEAANVDGTINILAAAEANGVQKFVHISTPSLYFQFRDALNIPETQPLGPRFCNDYAATKARAEHLVTASPLHTVILRPRGIFGPHDNAILPRIISAVRKGVLWLPSARNPEIDLTYVDNVADAAILALQQPVERGSVFNISNGEPVRLLDALTQLFNAMGRPTPIKTLPYGALAPVIAGAEWLRTHLPGRPEPKLTRYSAGLFHYHQTLDISKARTQLGYAPAVSIAEGIERYVHWRQSQAV
ncbi:NAD-dependent epimerase/dehydratase family protein [Hahella sp. KA22]|uniref:NAD-dependent epimerase/dehydratase family protein n=1 Tax=Hahella sp. KA22 TaxID=1628392 RepID=UPI000FDD798D|nr:NAD-dependent epimerase/dehydratase family protein [Hahella sp. KA22]AZZ94070.1 NAD-dependent epimerase/dehydratase family protein [Hahella sp. KA22]QAY57444.1 NAD-dependent epimerase/dehydratase family protein [Hahella sp. KA22]